MSQINYTVRWIHSAGDAFNETAALKFKFAFYWIYIKLGWKPCHRVILDDRSLFFGNRFAEADFRMYLRWIPDLFSTKYLLLFLLALRTSKSNRNYHYMFAVYIWGGSWRPHVRHFIAFLFISPCPCGRFTNAGIWKKSQTRWKSPRLYVLAMAFSKLRKKSTVSITRTQNKLSATAGNFVYLSVANTMFSFSKFLDKTSATCKFLFCIRSMKILW